MVIEGLYVVPVGCCRARQFTRGKVARTLRRGQIAMELEGRVAIITGGGAGIGRATAVLFARKGARVAVFDIDNANGEETTKLTREAGGEGRFAKVDVSDPTSVQVAVDEVERAFGRIDILVNNAGIYKKGDLLEASLEDWNRIIAINLTGAFLCSKYCLGKMVRNGGGVIVNVASEAGLVGIKGQVAYNVSKAGVIALTRSAAVDFADRNVRVNCICPGTTETPLVAEALRKEADPGAARRSLESCRPANRLGRPEEIANAILFLASDDVSYATGSVLVVDGGYTAQ